MADSRAFRKKSGAGAQQLPQSRMGPTAQHVNGPDGSADLSRNVLRFKPLQIMEPHDCGVALWQARDRRFEQLDRFAPDSRAAGRRR